ncbi:MAG: hypothetical protein U0798_08765 [Gemmataceae bacterium]
MSKAIACLFAACVVAGGAVFLHNGKCPFSSNCCDQATTCPTETATASASISCCDTEEMASCPACKALTQVSTKKASCCDAPEPTPVQDAFVAAFGGATVPGSK